MVAAEAGSGKLGSELRHGTGKPMMVLYKDEGDDVVIAGVVVEELRMLKQQTGPVKAPKWETAGVSSETW